MSESGENYMCEVKLSRVFTGTGSPPDKYFLRNPIILSVSSVTAHRRFFNFQTVFLKLKIRVRFPLASLKTFTDSKYCSESRIRITVLAFLNCHW